MFGAGYDPPWGTRTKRSRATDVRGAALRPSSSCRHLRERMRAVRDMVRVSGRPARSVPIIVLPGLGADDVSTRPLRWYLSRLGHRVVGWELGTNRLPVATAVSRFIPRLEAVAAEAGGPVTLVGWSLGGVVAREAARARPDLVAQVVTLGSPIVQSRGTGRADVRHGRVISVPVTSIFSKRDRIVDWRSSLDRTTPGVRNIEVGGSHVGLGLDPAVWRVVADAIVADHADEPVAGSDQRWFR